MSSSKKIKQLFFTHFLNGARVSKKGLFCTSGLPLAVIFKKEMILSLNPAEARDRLYLCCFSFACLSPIKPTFSPSVSQSVTMPPLSKANRILLLIFSAGLLLFQLYSPKIYSGLIDKSSNSSSNNGNGNGQGSNSWAIKKYYLNKERVVKESANDEAKVYGDCVLRLPLYYTDGAVFQMGPTKHTVWGFVATEDCDVTVTEVFTDGCTYVCIGFCVFIPVQFFFCDPAILELICYCVLSRFFSVLQSCCPRLLVIFLSYDSRSTLIRRDCR